MEQQQFDRRKFLQQTTLAAAGMLLASVESLALTSAGKIRVGVIGCGSVSGQYLPHLSKSPVVELVSCCDKVLVRAKNAAKEYNIPHVYYHIDNMLAGEKIDLLVNLTDMQEHGKLNRKALLAGKNVWSEKPLANTYMEGRELVNLASLKRTRIWAAPAVVNSPQFAFMNKMLREGKLGKVSAAHAHYGHTGPLWSAFFYEKLGGSLPDLGVYNLATLTGLLGPARSVVAITNIITPTRTVDDKGKIKVEAEDNAQLIMEHAGGVLSHVQCGFNYFDPYGHEGKGQERPSIQIWGTEGNMSLVGYDWAPHGVDMATSKEPATQRFVTDPKGYVWQEGATVIASAMAGGPEPRIATDHSLHVLELIEAARNSSASGRRIRLSSTFKWPMIKD